MSELVLSNRQRRRRLDLRFFRCLALSLLEKELGLGDYALGVQFVGSRTMARLNETFLAHPGPTDVITFDHRAEGDAEKGLYGEVFICIEVALTQSLEYNVPWQDEVARYFIHGVLHLLGYDDHRPQDRHRMKREENRLLNRLGQAFPLSHLAPGGKN